MLRIAVFSDVHGNLSGLEAVLSHISSQGDFSDIVFAGDACMFGPSPLECIEVLHRSGVRCLVGNTDHWILHPPPIDDSDNESVRARNQMLVDVAEWTCGEIGGEGVAWLRELQESFDMRISPTLDPNDDLQIVHAISIKVG